MPLETTLLRERNDPCYKICISEVSIAELAKYSHIGVPLGQVLFINNEIHDRLLAVLRLEEHDLVVIEVMGMVHDSRLVHAQVAFEFPASEQSPGRLASHRQDTTVKCRHTDQQKIQHSLQHLQRPEYTTVPTPRNHLTITKLRICASSFSSSPPSPAWSQVLFPLTPRSGSAKLTMHSNHSQGLRREELLQMSESLPASAQQTRQRELLRQTLLQPVPEIELLSAQEGRHSDVRKR